MNTSETENVVGPMHSAEIWISNILRVGVWISLALIFAGMVVTFVRHPEYRNSAADLSQLTNPGNAAPSQISDIIDGLKVLRGRAIIELGLLTLIATPVVRVATSLVVFAALRDRRFVLITLLVLVLLLLSFFLGKVEA